MANIDKSAFLLPNINNISSTTPKNITPNQSATPSVNFSDVLMGALKDVNSAQINADDAVQSLAAGEANIQDTMIALQKADVSMKLMLEVRNKVLEAYQEVMRTQI